jgi:hypothetical protein
MKEIKKAEKHTRIFLFSKRNYTLLLIGLGLIGLGFILMIGGGSDDPNVFNENIFSHRRITVAPILILSGYVVEIFAIMSRPKKKDTEENAS